MRQNRGRKDRSTISKIDFFIFLEICVCLFSTVVYVANIKYAGCTSSKQSVWIAIAFAGIAAMATFIVTIRDRSKLQGVFGVLAGLLGYTLYIYWHDFTSLCAICLWITLMIVIASFISYLALSRRKKGSYGGYLWARFVDSLYLSRILIAGFAIFACVYLPYNCHLHAADLYVPSEIYNVEDYTIKEIYGDEYRLGLNIDRIKAIVNEDDWQKLSLKQKQDTVIAVVECEARYLGIPYKLDVRFTDELEYKTKGYYSHSERLVCINNDLLNKDGAIATLSTTLHEMRHCYQHAICDAYVKLTPEERNLYCFYGVDKWCENINNYVNGDENYYEYLDQRLESDSRVYASEQVKIYIQQIGTLLSDAEE